VFAKTNNGIEPIVLTPYFQVKDKVDDIEVWYGIEVFIGKTKLKDFSKVFVDIIIPSPESLHDFDGLDGYRKLAKHLVQTESYRTTLHYTENLKRDVIKFILADQKI
jgi:hypothetical protein